MKRRICPAAATAALILALAMSACGGSAGGDGGVGDGGGGGIAGPVAPTAGTSAAPPALVDGTDLPLSATSDSAAATAFANQLASMPDEISEPIRLGNAALASSETDEPVVLN